MEKSVQPLNGGADNPSVCLFHANTYVYRQGGSVPEVIPDETRYRLLKYLEANPDASQRALARELDVSLGKVNYCIKALVDRGWVKIQRFRKSNNKLAYVYKITPRGIEAKAEATIRFLNRKLAEYEDLHTEIESLRAEARKLGVSK